MKYKKIMLTIIIGMFLLTIGGIVNAEEYLGKQYESVNIIETCVLNGFPCPSDFLCNITFVNPDNDLVILNLPMTRNDTIYNYTFTSTEVLGEYDINVYCNNLTLSGNAASTLTITTTGREPKVKITVLLLICAFVIFVLALYLKSHAIGFIAGILFTIAGIYLMIYGLGDVADLYTRAISLVTIAFGSFVTLIAGYEWLTDLDE